MATVYHRADIAPIIRTVLTLMEAVTANSLNLKKLQKNTKQGVTASL